MEVDLTKRSRITAILLLGCLAAQLVIHPAPVFAEVAEPVQTAVSASVSADTAGTALAAIGTTGAAINVSGAAISTTGTAIGATGSAIALTTTPSGMLATASSKTLSAPNVLAVESESLWYSAKNPMLKAHQKLLYEFCRKNGIGYVDMLALISTESGFNEKCVSVRKYYGYFQIGKGHFANLAASLQTKNAPLDGAVNIQWGTAMFGWIMADARVKKLPVEKRLDAALSIYQRGPIGYDRYGVNKTFLARFYKKRAIVSGWHASP